MIYEDTYVYVDHIDQRHAPTLSDLNSEETEAFGIWGQG